MACFRFPAFLEARAFSLFLLFAASQILKKKKDSHNTPLGIFFPLPSRELLFTSLPLLGFLRFPPNSCSSHDLSGNALNS